MRYIQYTHPDCPSHYRAIFQIGVVILITLWSWPAVAKPPGSRDNNGSAQRGNTERINRSAPQNNQQERTFQRQTVSQSSPRPAGEVISTPSKVFQPSPARDGPSVMHFQRNSVSSPPIQASQMKITPQGEAFRSMI